MTTRKKPEHSADCLAGEAGRGCPVCDPPKKRAPRKPKAVPVGDVLAQADTLNPRHRQCGLINRAELKRRVRKLIGAKRRWRSEAIEILEARLSAICDEALRQQWTRILDQRHPGKAEDSTPTLEGMPNVQG